MNAKIADFGLSRSIGVKDELLMTTNTEDYGTGPVGTFVYMAPQAFDRIAKMSGEIAKAADVYAFAIVMYELLCGRQQWVAEKVKSVWTLGHYVCHDERRPSWGPREHSIRAEYIDFVKRCWAQKWQDCPNLEEVAKQLRMWTQDFNSRESNSSLSVTEASGNWRTGSPSILTKQDYAKSAESRASKVAMDNTDFYIDTTILNTYGFNRFVRQVESQKTRILKVDRLDFLSLAPVTEERRSCPSQGPSQNPTLGPDSSKKDGITSKKFSKTFVDSFVGAVNAYIGNSVSETPLGAAGAAVAQSDLLVQRGRRQPGSSGLLSKWDSRAARVRHRYGGRSRRTWRRPRPLLSITTAGMM